MECRKESDRRVELIHNGRVVSSQEGTAGAGDPFIFKTSQEFTGSGWLCARRMNQAGYQVHTSAVYVTVDDVPVRASAADAEFFVAWIDNILGKIAPGGIWNRYFTHDLDIVQDRYKKAKQIYLEIAEESQQ